MAERRGADDRCALPQHESVTDDLRLLFDPVALERPAGHEAVMIAAEGVARERQEDAALVLPDVTPFSQK